jgi:hypothetical protein
MTLCSHAAIPARAAGRSLLRGVSLAGLAVLLSGIVGPLQAGKEKPPAEEVPVDPQPRIKVQFADGLDEAGGRLGQTMTFGIVTVDLKRPDLSKRLTYDTHGRTNSTVVRIDGKDRVYGAADGKWEKLVETQGKKTPALTSKNKSGGQKVESVWLHDEGVQVTQIVEVVPGKPVEIDGKSRHLLETAVVRYRIENMGKKARHVGLRVMVDTMIGDNDGAPFVVPGLPGLVDDLRDFAPPGPVPNFVQVLERPNLKDPGLIALMHFKLGGKVETPTRASLTHWPGTSREWEVPMRPIGQDSSVVLYWNEKELKPGEKREVGFAYGLGHVTTKMGRLGLVVEGDFSAGGEIDLIALVSKPAADEKLTVQLPKGFSLVKGSAATQAVPKAAAPGRAVPITWRIRSGQAGTYALEVRSSTGESESHWISIREAPK